MQMGPAKDRTPDYMNFHTDWSTKGIPQCAVKAPQLSQVALFLFEGVSILQR